MDLLHGVCGYSCDLEKVHSSDFPFVPWEVIIIILIGENN